jgi:hypothetical protein
MELSKVIISHCSIGELRCTRLKNDDHPGVNESGVFQIQLTAMNLLFSYASLLHLYRRALLLDAASEPVQEVVTMMTTLLRENIPLGSSIEACLSFPIFSAGCEAIDDPTRDEYRARLNGMLRFGLGQIEKARAIMEECWNRNVPWTDIVEDLGYAIVLA